MMRLLGRGACSIGLLATALIAGTASTGTAQVVAAPALTKPQRVALQAAVTLADRVAGTPETLGLEWPVHVLRASDGSHYVAFRLFSPPRIAAGHPVVLYVRLSTRRSAGAVAAAERSAVSEWLAGARATPLRPERGIAFGEMPTYGAGAAAARGAANSMQSLRLLEMERERARERREEHDRARKAALEGEATRVAHPLLPFEDFDLAAVAATDTTGGLTLDRSLTTGPGDYDLTVAWADPAAKDPAATAVAVTRPLRLPIASTTEFGLSSVIVADDVRVRESAFGAEQQTAHPYSIGSTEVVPSRDQVFTNDEALALFVQVINPRGGIGGKPDVAVGFRVYRITARGQETVGTLNPQVYNQTTLPADFDAAKGHPLFAAVQIPLRTFKRGSYKIQILAEDRVAGVNSATEATFSVTATPATLLRDAPALVEPFQRELLLTPALLNAIVATLRAPNASGSLLNALVATRERRFADVIRESSAGPANEEGQRALLRSLARYAVGDSTVAVGAALRQAVAAAADPAILQVVGGALHATEAQHREASDAWVKAAAAGFNGASLRVLLIDALLRQGDTTKAIDVGRAALAAHPGDLALTRRLAASYLAASQPAAALAVLDAALTTQPDDVEMQWLTIHALYTGYATGQGAGSDPTGRDRLTQLASQYVAANGRHAAVASEWLASVK